MPQAIGLPFVSEVTKQDLEQFADTLPPSAKELIEIAGAEAAARLISTWPGTQFPVVRNPKMPRCRERMARLREIVGEPAFQRLANAYPSNKTLYVPSLEQAQRGRVSQAIKADYDRLTIREGYSHRDALFELVISYRKSSRAIEKWLSR